MSCILCKEMPCCPEHCCNWDDCNCNDCDACVAKPLPEPQQPKPVLQDPVKIILLGNNTGSSASNPDPLPYEEEKKQTFEPAESKDQSPHSPRAAGNSIFGIRYLKNKR